MKVGQKVWVRNSYSKNPPEETTVVSVGKKYFTVDAYPRDKFSLDTLIQQSERFNPHMRVFLSLEDIEKEKRLLELRRIVPEKVRYATHEQLEEIAKILGI